MFLDGASRDHCRIVRFPEPRSEDLSVLVQRIMTDILAEQEFDEQWLGPIDEVEIATVAEAWRGGSLRTLRRMIEVVPSSWNVRH